MRRLFARILCAAFAIVGGAGSILAGDVDYQRQIKPLLAEKCAACHGPLRQEAGLRLDAAALALKGAESGAVILPGNAIESELFQRVSADDAALRMPPEGEGEPLTPEQLQLIKSWIADGAQAPADEAYVASPAEHWAYQQPQKAPLPDNARLPTGEVHHPIDAFMQRDWQDHNLLPAGPADKATLLRRVYFDVIGLPPTPAQLADFLADESPAAWERVIAGLLESPHYGERWGRHWMDVWRYSDWDGYMQELRGSQRHIWRWRDWIVRSLNEGKGYDQMVREMLAGDELAPLDEDMLVATGFLARNYHNSNRNIWLDATVEHTAKAFLGMTLNCARCHDHKFDPLPQSDYYAFRAIFEPHNVRTERLTGQRDLNVDGLPRALDAEPAAETYLFVRGDEKQPDKDHPLAPAVPGILGGELQIKPVELPLLAYYPALQEFAIVEDRQQRSERLAAAEQELADFEAAAVNELDSATLLQWETLMRKVEAAELALAAFEQRVAADRAKFHDASCEASASNDTAKPETSTPRTTAAAPTFAELAQTAAATERQAKLVHAELAVLESRRQLALAEASGEQDAGKMAAQIKAAQSALAKADEQLTAAREEATKTDGAYTPLGTEYPHASTGRRLALAQWITSRQNPLTARVAVNQIWLRHFGQPLVENVFDFGLRSPRPTQAELLDWLAVEFMESGWNMKHVHRLILTSAVWQATSSASAELAAHNLPIDPDNKLFWRANVRRLDAELVRDNVLAISGTLDRALGGQEVDFHSGEKSPRRSIYIQTAYEKQMPFLTLFDAASPNECYRRSESIIPQQALALSNSTLALAQSRLLARSLWSSIQDEAKPPGSDANAAFVRAAFLRMLSREPAAEELATCTTFLSEQTTLLETGGSALAGFPGSQPAEVRAADDPAGKARESLIHVLMNHNDFVSIR